MDNSFGFKRLINEYLNYFDENYELVFQDKDFHIQQLSECIGSLDELCSLLQEQLAEYEEIFKDLYEDSPNTFLEKLQLPFLRLYANYEYRKISNELVDLIEKNKKLKNMLDRLKKLKAFD